MSTTISFYLSVPGDRDAALDRRPIRPIGWRPFFPKEKR